MEAMVNLVTVIGFVGAFWFIVSAIILVSVSIASSRFNNPDK